MFTPVREIKIIQCFMKLIFPRNFYLCTILMDISSVGLSIQPEGEVEGCAVHPLETRRFAPRQADPVVLLRWKSQ
jgi:hypothetical protein